MKERAAIVYQNDVLWMIASGLAGGNVKLPRYTEIITPKVEKRETAEDIIVRVRNGLRRLRKGGKKWR